MIGVDFHCVNSPLLTNTCMHTHTEPMILKVFQTVFSLWMESFQRAHKNQITLNLEVPLMMKQRVCSEQIVLNNEGHDRGCNL
jgi:hypothetical protein